MVADRAEETERPSGVPVAHLVVRQRGSETDGAAGGGDEDSSVGGVVEDAVDLTHEQVPQGLPGGAAIGGVEDALGAADPEIAGAVDSESADLREGWRRHDVGPVVATILGECRSSKAACGDE